MLSADWFRIIETAVKLLNSLKLQLVFWCRSDYGVHCMKFVIMIKYVLNSEVSELLNERLEDVIGLLSEARMLVGVIYLEWPKQS